MIDALLHNIKGDYMIWIIGTGTIALEYAKILNQLGHEFIAVGRSGKNADEFIEAGAKEVVSGGLNNYLAASPTTPQKVIVATNVSQLAEITIALLNYGVKDILVEKPGFCQPTELPTVVILTKEKVLMYFWLIIVDSIPVCWLLKNHCRGWWYNFFQFRIHRMGTCYREIRLPSRSV